MSSKYIYGFITFLILTLAAACNSSSDNVILIGGSSDAQINSFSIDATPFTDMDKLTYPALKTTKFTILNKGEFVSEIFNLNPLPVNTDIRGLKVNLGYTNTPSKIELIYEGLDGDSIVEWNTSDSIQFKLADDGKYTPLFKVHPLSGEADARTYTIDIRIHDKAPEGIEWEAMEGFDLLFKGETKTIISNDKTTLFSLTRDPANKIHFYKAPMSDAPTWESPEEITTFPENLVIKSFLNTEDKLVVMDNDGQVYTSPITDGVTWEIHNSKMVESILGLLPNIPTKRSLPLTQFLITYIDANNNKTFAKTEDFDNYTNIETAESDFTEFPIRDFSTVYYNDSHEDYVVVVGGTDKNKKVVEKSWIIKNISADKINILPGAPSHTLPFKLGVTAFNYDETIYAMSSDSLSLYSSRNGDTWYRSPKEQSLHSEMNEMNKPSIVVDKENYVWIFGGIDKEKRNPNKYSRKVWRGRLNRLAE